MRACVCLCGSEKIRDYHCDALLAEVLSHPRLWPFSLNEDVVANNGALSPRRQRELRETAEERQVEEERKVVNKRKEAKEEEEEWIESAIVSASSISSYINVSCTLSLITVSPPHWLYPLVQGERHHSLISLYRFSPSPLPKSLHDPPLLSAEFFSLLSLPLSMCFLSLSFFISPSLLPSLPPSGLLASRGDASPACPHETSQFSASSADE